MGNHAAMERELNLFILYNRIISFESGFRIKEKYIKRNYNHCKDAKLTFNLPAVHGI
jgi:hypothetical protein